MSTSASLVDTNNSCSYGANYKVISALAPAPAPALSLPKTLKLSFQTLLTETRMAATSVNGVKTITLVINHVGVQVAAKACCYSGAHATIKAYHRMADIGKRSIFCPEEADCYLFVFCEYFF